MRHIASFTGRSTPTPPRPSFYVTILVERQDQVAVLTVCLLYTSDAADDSLRVDLGGRRIIKKIFFKKKTAYEINFCLVGSEMCIRDSSTPTPPRPSFYVTILVESQDQVAVLLSSGPIHEYHNAGVET